MRGRGDQKDVLLIICDISGYTRYVTAHREELMHAYVVVTELMKALLRQAKGAFQVAKLEGDAVFLYAIQDEPQERRELVTQRALLTLYQLFEAFEEKLAELEQSNICGCQACKSVDRLRLKIVAHCGTALFHKLGRFNELAGPDVILTHKLLKNSVDQDHYLLLTEAAQSHWERTFRLDPNQITGRVEAEEIYEEFGPVRVFVYPAPARAVGERADQPTRRYASLPYQAKNILIKIFRGRLMQLHLLPRPRCTNLLRL
jgi:class 3 adenylate cyclase